VGVKRLDDLGDLVGRCKEHCQGAFWEARVLRWLIDLECSSRLGAA